MRLAGIDVDAAPELIFPILLAALVVLAGLAARLARGAVSRWLSSKPAVSIPVACAVVIGGVLWIPDIGLPGRLGRWLRGRSTSVSCSPARWWSRAWPSPR